MQGGRDRCTSDLSEASEPARFEDSTSEAKANIVGIVVSLRQFVDEMNSIFADGSVLMNRRTGEFLALTHDDIAAADNDDDDPADDGRLPDWQQEQMPLIREAISSDDWLTLPSQFDIHEYQIMQEFCAFLDDEDVQRELTTALRGSGAFRRFKDRVRARGIEQDWYGFRDAALRRIAIDWLDGHEIPYGD